MPHILKAAAPAVRRLFHWRYAGWAIALAGGAALTAALADKFALAYVFTSVCCTCAVGCWLSSDALKEKQPHSLLFLPDGTSHAPSMLGYRLWKVTPACVIVLFFVGCILYIYHLEVANELEQSADWLYPANDPIPAPESGCDKNFPLPDGSIALYLGNSRITAGRDVSMWQVITPQDRRIAEPVLVVEQDPRGRIAIDLDVRSKDQRIIARIKRNHFELNPNNILTHSRPDRSTLIVTDQEGTEVLRVRYLNPHAIYMTGTFYVVGQNEPVVISEDKQDMGGGRLVLSGACSTPLTGDISMSISTSGDGSGNHEYDYPGSKERPLSPVRKWNTAKGEWEHEFRNLGPR